MDKNIIKLKSSEGYVGILQADFFIIDTKMDRRKMIEANENSEQDWSYLNNIITWTGSKGKIAQFPREVDVSLDLTPIFKERPITGMANFGHAPRDLNNYGLVGGFNNEFSEALTVSPR
jgi:hypothetical protein